MRMNLFLFSLSADVLGAEKRITILHLLLFTVILALFVVIILLVLEFREKRKARKRFVVLSEKMPAASAGNRSLPRISIPETLNVNIIVSPHDHVKLKSRMINISATGFCISADQELERIEINQPLFDVQVQTPVNEFRVRELKPIWLVEENDRKLLGMQIVVIEEAQLQLMNDFIYYLKEYLFHVL